MRMRFSGVMEVSPAQVGSDGRMREGTWRNMGWADILVERDESRHEETEHVQCVPRDSFCGLESSFSTNPAAPQTTLLKP
jgi:hypothetical protein